MGDKLTYEERVQLVSMYRSPGATQRSVATEFHKLHPHRAPVSHTTIGRLIHRFKQTGSVSDHTRSGRPKKITGVEASAMVLAKIFSSPNKSARELSRETGVSKTSLLRILNFHRFHPFRIQRFPSQNEGTADQRMKFCSRMLLHSKDSILFSGEAAFHLNGHVNTHNMSYSSDSESREDTMMAHNQSLIVWAGVLEEELVGPYFFDTGLNHQTYLVMLKDFLAKYLANLPPRKMKTLTLMHDDAPAHKSDAIKAFLDDKFPQKWMGEGSQVEYPSSSPDLSPLNFFLWGHLKSQVYYHCPLHSLAELKDAITKECHKISPSILKRVKSSFEARIQACITTEGGFLEHI